MVSFIAGLVEECGTGKIHYVNPELVTVKRCNDESEE